MSRKFTSMRFGKKSKQIELLLERKPWKNGFAGLAFSDLFQESIVIMVDDDRLDMLCIRDGYITVKEDGSCPIILLSGRVFDRFKQGDVSARFLLFHEFGHYACGHLNHLPDLSEEMEHRMACIAAGHASSEEVEADRFAAEYLGVENALKALSEAQERRFCLDLNTGTCNEDANTFALAEYDLRMDALCAAFGLKDTNEEDDDEEYDA